MGHAFTGVIGSCRGADTVRERQDSARILNVRSSAISPRTSVLLRCGDAEGEGGEGEAKAGGDRLGSDSPPAEVEGTAGEEAAAAAAAAAEEVGRFWKYCSPGSSSSRTPHGYTCRSPTVTTTGCVTKCEHRLRTSQTCSSSSSSGL